MSQVARSTLFPPTPNGRHTAHWFIGSTVISVIAFGVSLIPLGRMVSYFIIPVAFFLTITHHVAVIYLLTSEMKSYMNTSGPPSDQAFKCLKSSTNYCLLICLIVIWLAAGVACFAQFILFFNGEFYLGNADDSRYFFCTIAVGALSGIESAALIVVARGCHRLGREIEPEAQSSHVE
jgi:hypothetical protein